MILHTRVLYGYSRKGHININKNDLLIIINKLNLI